jgi:ATP-dependent RNA helicase DHX8/PRP22
MIGIGYCYQPISIMDPRCYDKLFLLMNENGNFHVKLNANATKIIADLRRPLVLLMKGKTINHPDLTLSVVQLLVSCDGMALLKSVEKDTGT